MNTQNNPEVATGTEVGEEQKPPSPSSGEPEELLYGGEQKEHRKTQLRVSWVCGEATFPVEIVGAPVREEIPTLENQLQVLAAEGKERLRVAMWLSERDLRELEGMVKVTPSKKEGAAFRGTYRGHEVRVENLHWSVSGPDPMGCSTSYPRQSVAGTVGGKPLTEKQVKEFISLIIRVKQIDAELEKGIRLIHKKVELAEISALDAEKILFGRV